MGLGMNRFGLAGSLAVVVLTWSLTALAAGARLQVFFPADFKDQEHQQKVYEKVAGAWRRPAEHPKAGSKSVVIATILRDGRVPDARLHYQSGSKAWDEAALAALQRAQPLPPLPKSYSPISAEVHFHFEYVE
jgi:protein TonB